MKYRDGIRYIVLCLFIWAQVFIMHISIKAQTQSAEKDMSFIRDHKFNSLIQIDEKSFSVNTIGEYGKLFFEKHSKLDWQKSISEKYFFQGQEFDNDLQLFFFPSRIYSSEIIRFFEPDPKSQYFSPYIFVKGDPLNYVDLNGEEGTPLVLYQESHYNPHGVPLSLQDVKKDVTDAHYVPMSDFINGEVGSLSGWRGDVFIYSHMETHEGREVLVEMADKKSQFKTREADDLQMWTDKRGGEYISMDARHFAKRLKDFSINRRVPLKTVVAGGCQGETAAENLSNAFLEGDSGGLTGEVKFHGLLRGNDAMFVGKDVPRSEGAVGFKSVRMYNVPTGASEKMLTTKDAQGREYARGYYVRNKDGEFKQLQYLDTDEVDDLIHCRIPTRAHKIYSNFSSFY